MLNIRQNKYNFKEFIIMLHDYFFERVFKFFIEKIKTIKMEFPLLEECLAVYSFVDIDIIMHACTAVLIHFIRFTVMFCRVFLVN